MDFSPKAWFENVNSHVQLQAADKPPSLSERVRQVFATLPDERTGSPYTDAEVARMSLGALAEDEVIALAGALGVDPAYFLDLEEQPPIIDREALEIFQDETTSAIARESNAVARSSFPSSSSRPNRLRQILSQVPSASHALSLRQQVVVRDHEYPGPRLQGRLRTPPPR
jgi:hypothetical protein